MFGAQVPSGSTMNFVAELATRKIYISQRGSSLRFAPHLHVNESDVERLLGAMDALVG
jgi:capsular polysaccharide biosynthesis protein